MIKLRTFASKCTPQALEYLDEHVNDWIDETGAQVKFANQNFGVVEGKGGQRDPHLFINIWYEPASG